MIYPESLENKIGFTAIRGRLKELCIGINGRELVDDVCFLTDFQSIRHKLESTSEMLSIVGGDNDIPLPSADDIRPQLRTLSVGRAFLTTSELIGLRSSLTAMSNVSAFFSVKDPEEKQRAYPTLFGIVKDMATFEPCISSINRIIDRYGNVLDSASPELSDIRRDLNRMNGRVNSVMRSVMARAQKEGILEADATPAMRNGRLVLPVEPMNKRRLGGIVHDESASGKTVFIEPAEVVEANNRIRELEMAEKREISRILTILTESLRPYAAEISASNATMAELDFIHAKALYAQETDGCLPNLSKEPELEMYHACHPGLLASLTHQGKQIVPLDIILNKQNRILIISGPNAGGKSVCLETVGILQYMLQCGLLPSVYSNSHFGIFDDIFIDIGDDQSIENDLSTYSSHLRNMKLLLQKGRETSLVLIDEFGGGTEPQIGGALAQAILRQINNRKMWGIITTHYQNLKQFAADTDGLINGSMLYDRQKMQPLFRLSIGNPGSSFAVEIARSIGLPREIIEDAEALVGSDYINMDKYLLDIARDKRYWENKRQSIRQKEKKIEEVLERYETDASELRSQRKAIISEAKDEAKRLIEESNASIERTIHEIRRVQADKEQTRALRKQLSEEKENIVEKKQSKNAILDKAPKQRKRKQNTVCGKTMENKPIQPGDIVKLGGEGTPGKVISVDGKQAQVVFGMIKTTVDVNRLQHTLSKLPSATKSGSSSFLTTATVDTMRTRQLQFKQDIDVRGMRAVEAIQAVTYFIDDAIQFNAERVRILHGTGTGALRQSLREYLSTVKGVRSYHDEDVRFGGAGITVVELD